jgi:hypothetical protein
MMQNRESSGAVVKMIFRVFLLTTLWQAVSALSPSAAIKDFQHKACGISLAVMTAIPLPAHAVEVVKIDADIPALIQMAKDNKDVAFNLVQQIASAVHISKMPSNLVEFARDAAAGDVLVEINGFPLDISVLSEKGAIDLGISTEQGDISFTVSSTYLPRLPFLSKRVVPISSIDMTSGVDKTSGVDSATVKADFLDPLGKGWTNLQVLGSGVLGLGATYAGSYAYYVKVIEDEEAAAREKKAAAVEKKAEAAAAAKKVDTAMSVAVTAKTAARVEED